MNRKVLAVPLLAMATLLFAGQAWAHAVVKPSEVGIGKFQTFTLGVPSEKPIATVGIRLVVPDGLNFFTPNVKYGWKITEKKQATGNKIKDDDGMMVEEQKLVEIDWAGGSIPAGQRDEFVFSAQVPSVPTTLNWKVYQTYADGSVMSWDLGPNDAQPKDAAGNMDFSAYGPYSMTKVIDDLSATPSTPATTNTSASNSNSTLSLVLSGVALALALSAWQTARKKN